MDESTGKDNQSDHVISENIAKGDAYLRKPSHDRFLGDEFKQAFSHVKTYIFLDLLGQNCVCFEQTHLSFEHFMTSFYCL